MTLCVKTLYHTFPEIKAFGCCHEVFGTQKVLKGICEETMGLKDVDRRDIHVNVLESTTSPGSIRLPTRASTCSRYTATTLTSTSKKATTSRTRTGPTAPSPARIV